MILYSFKNLEQLTRATSGNAYRSAARLLEFKPTDGDRAAVRFRGLRNATIDGNGATLRLDGRGYYFVLEGCERVLLQNFTLETSHPEYLEFTVKGSGFGGADVRFGEEYAVTAGSPLSVKSGEKELIAQLVSPVVYCRDLNTEKIRRESSDPVAKLKGASKISPESGATAAKLSFSGLTSPVKKDCVYIRFDASKTCPGILLINCKDITVRNVTIRYCHGSAIKADMCENVTVQEVTLRAQSGRSVATLGSAFEAVECSGSLYLSDCLLAATLADTVSVRGALYDIASASGNSLTLRSADATALPPFEKGDVATLSDAAFAPVASLIVAAYDKYSRTVTFEQAAPANAASMHVENSSLHTADVFFRRTTLYGSPDNGLAFSTSGFVRADYCNFKNIVGKAVVCMSGITANAGLAKRVEIEGNVFEQCLDTAVELLPLCSGKAMLGDVDIYANKWMECARPAIAAARCASVSVKRNVGDSDKYQTKISQCPKVDSDGVEYMY